MKAEYWAVSALSGEFLTRETAIVYYMLMGFVAILCNVLQSHKVFGKPQIEVATVYVV